MSDAYFRFKKYINTNYKNLNLCLYHKELKESRYFKLYKYPYNIYKGDFIIKNQQHFHKFYTPSQLLKFATNFFSKRNFSRINLMLHSKLIFKILKLNIKPTKNHIFKKIKI
ncbi:hypothetical protein EDEG_02232 [Edhazardia aedis USNM 41457]|uniref:Uncharacterized protein n=1 Tax=Edhazardia aedis (strain USNM 41457) TaxID=1003232 RepID=J9DQ37_EDHAE|nr:hypothetical protein EDEG_02232 [Edhazardia aedis USNM 41457]|eukprot:EJW03467.1 hypothetical protein EDEG_02232 [Edhazardia aedis USNM 41457]